MEKTKEKTIVRFIGDNYSAFLLQEDLNKEEAAGYSLNKIKVGPEGENGHLVIISLRPKEV